MNASTILLCLSVLTASLHMQDREKREKPGLAAPRLLTKTKTSFVHLIWTKDGNQILFTDKSTGSMSQLMLTEVRPIHSVRKKYAVSRLIGVIQAEDNLLALVASVTIPYPMSRGKLYEPDKKRVLYELWEFSLNNGKHLGSRRVAPSETWSKENKDKIFLPLALDDLTGPLSRVEGRFRVFGKALD